MTLTSQLILRQWISQLQNTSHNQGIKYLRTYEEGVRYYSALGLYCNILIQNDIGSWRSVSLGSDLVYRFCVGDEDFTFFLSQRVLDYVGLNISYAIYICQLNDHGWSFQQIAEEIQAGFPNMNKSSGIFIPQAPHPNYETHLH